MWLVLASEASERRKDLDPGLSDVIDDTIWEFLLQRSPSVHMPF